MFPDRFARYRCRVRCKLARFQRSATRVVHHVEGAVYGAQEKVTDSCLVDDLETGHGVDCFVSGDETAGLPFEYLDVCEHKRDRGVRSAAEHTLTTH